MELRDFGRLGQISALTLGGGGIAGVWGRTDRREAVATVHAALDAGITMLDLAPSYGTGAESEHAAAEALRTWSAPPGADPMITSKVQLHDLPPSPGTPGCPRAGATAAHIRRSLHESLTRLGRDHLDLFLLHTQLHRTATAIPDTLDEAVHHDEVVPEFERLRDEGLIRAWGITAVGDPAPLTDAITTTPRPDAAQIVVNALDQNGDLWMHGDTTRPDNAALISSAGDAGVAVIGIRVVAAGSLTSGLDRTVPPGHPAAVDFDRAGPFRRFAAELGETPAALAHRYALTVPGVATIVLGVKNRTELAECLAAEARGPLTPAELDAVTALTTTQVR